MNIGLSGIVLLMIAVLLAMGWLVGRLMGWSPVLSGIVVLGLVGLIGALQVWRALARQRRLMGKGRWPPDGPRGAA
jgi:hypothetical protein